MKLYTEEQVRRAIAIGFDWCHQKQIPSDWMIDDFIKELTPTELPSDEEIGKSRDEHIPIDESDMWSERFYFTIGAKWMRDKIQEKINPNQ